MPIGPQKMPFLSHLAELRQRILVIVMTVGIGSVAAYPFTKTAVDWLFGPIAPYLSNNALYLFGPFEAFLFRFKVAFYFALILTSPVWLYQLLAFFLPALKENERKFFMPTFIAILVLFISGNLFAHQFVLPVSFQWLLTQSNGGIDLSGSLVTAQTWLHGVAAFIPLPAASHATHFSVNLQTLGGADQFLGGVLIFMVAFGATFELPVLLFFLIGVGIVKYRDLRSNWRWVYLGLFTFASLATPDWSWITIAILFGVATVLYEVTMVVARIAFASRIKTQTLEAAKA
jgi:sec-independent protein translocase protein TatC